MPEHMPASSDQRRDVRNLSCTHYSKCLDRSARLNLARWTCHGCEDRSAESQYIEADLRGYYLLLWALFKPDLYRRHRESERTGAALTEDI